MKDGHERSRCASTAAGKHHRHTALFLRTLKETDRKRQREVERERKRETERERE